MFLSVLRVMEENDHRRRVHMYTLVLMKGGFMFEQRQKKERKRRRKKTPLRFDG